MNLYGKNNKNCIVYNDEIEQDAISQIISILDGKAFKDVPVRIMPDVHLGADIVIGFTPQRQSALPVPTCLEKTVAWWPCWVWWCWL